MNKVDTLLSFTEDLLSHVNKSIEEKNREELITLLPEKMAERETLIQALSPPYTSEEKQKMQEVLDLDKIIQEKMQHVFQALKSEMRYAKQQKQSTKKYLDPYRQVATNDGSYWDKKN